MDVIPAIDLLGGRVVRLEQGRYDRVTVYREDAVGAARELVAAGASRIHVVDLEGARSGTAAQADLVRRIVGAVGSAARVQVGGGLRTREMIDRWIGEGVDRVVVGTAAIRDEAMIASACDAHPEQVVVAIDARDGNVAIEGWLEDSGVPAGVVAKKAESWGAAAILFTNIARDGTRQGPDVAATAALARSVSTPVLASGGVGSLDDLRALAAERVIAGCIVGRAIYDGSFTVADAIAAVRESGR